MVTKQYMVFGFEHYYPSGGMTDFVNDYDNFEDAKAAAFEYIDKSIYKGNVHIFDLETRKICYNLDKEYDKNEIEESPLDGLAVTNDEIINK